MRRGSLTLENLQRFIPNVAKRLASSRDQLDISKSKETLSNSCCELPVIHKGFQTSSSWASVQSAILSIFDQQSMTTLERTLLCENMRTLCQTDIGPFIYEHYKIHLMPRGMKILFNKINSGLDKATILVKMWNDFYREILPLLQAVFLPIPIEVRDIAFKHATLLGFRDNVLFKLQIEDIIEKCRRIEEQAAALSQMCLVLQHVQESWNLTENDMRLEKLLARLVKPYLGHAGLYDGDTTPVISSDKPVLKNKNNQNYRYFNSGKEDPNLLRMKSAPDRPISMTSLKLPDEQEVTPSPASHDSRLRSRRHSVQFDLTFN